jgi:hypothetical protein
MKQSSEHFSSLLRVTAYRSTKYGKCKVNSLFFKIQRKILAGKKYFAKE